MKRSYTLRASHLRTSSVIAAILLMAACSRSPKEQIIGKWRVSAPAGQPDAQMEFKPEGKMSMTYDNITAEGTYQFTDDTHVKTDFNVGGETHSETWQVSFDDKDTMVTVDSKGTKDTIHRIK